MFAVHPSPRLATHHIFNNISTILKLISAWNILDFTLLMFMHHSLDRKKMNLQYVNLRNVGNRGKKWKYLDFAYKALNVKCTANALS